MVLRYHQPWREYAAHWPEALSAPLTGSPQYRVSVPGSPGIIAPELNI